MKQNRKRLLDKKGSSCPLCKPHKNGGARWTDQDLGSELDAREQMLEGLSYTGEQYEDAREGME